VVFGRAEDAMKTELLITRATTFYGTKADPISLEEWLAAVAADRELRLSENANDQVAAAHWVSHEVRMEEPWFVWSEDGDVLTEMWDRKVLGKALQLARVLRARVLDAQNREYRSTADFPTPSPGPPPAAPPRLLQNVRWSFPVTAPADPVAFDAAVWQHQYEDGNHDCWDPEEVVLGSPRVCVSYLCWRDGEQVEPVVELAGDDGKSFRAGELLFKIHRAVAEDLQRGDHRFLEGMVLARPPQPGQPPLYGLRLGS
jgi:hypothetical protein